MRALDQLPPHDEKGNVIVVVETPRDARVKLKYEPELGAITLGRALPLGMHYPFDWGFVPSTCAEDGDPLDAMVLNDAPTSPGVAISCVLAGVVKVEQSQGRKRIRNDRIIAIAVDAPRFDGVRDVRELPKRTRDELQAFFVAVVVFSDKNPRMLGWSGPREAERLLQRAIQSSSSSRSRRGS